MGYACQNNDICLFCVENKGRCRYSAFMAPPPRIPDAERDVLACLEQLGEATVKQLREALHNIRPMQAASVLTLLNRLEARQLVSKRKAERGKAFIFKPSEKSARAWREQVKDLFQRAFGGDTMSFMTSFFETQKPTAKEIEDLQQLLNQLKAENSRPNRSGDDKSD